MLLFPRSLCILGGSGLTGRLRWEAASCSGVEVSSMGLPRCPAFTDGDAAVIKNGLSDQVDG